MKLLTLLLLLVMSLPAGLGFAETLELKNGQTVSGTVLEETDKYIKINFQGTNVTYYRDEIADVIREGASSETIEVVSKPVVSTNPDLRGNAGVIVEGFPAEEGVTEIALNEPIELSYKSKEEILKLREEYVNQHADLNPGYAPSSQVYGAMEGNKPWWGLRGQFCNGSGENSTEGPSEESRFLANPFLLLGVDEGKSFTIPEPCSPVYPVPSKLIWSVKEKKAMVTYNLSDFLKEKEDIGFQHEDITFMLENSNARDFGYAYVYADEKSSNVSGLEATRFFKEASSLKAMIHVGPSCGQAGGCNNVSPMQPELQFKVDELPATLYCKLWYKLPRAPAEDADFTFIINFE